MELDAAEAALEIAHREKQELLIRLKRRDEQLRQIEEELQATKSAKDVDDGAPAIIDPQSRGKWSVGDEITTQVDMRINSDALGCLNTQYTGTPWNARFAPWRSDGRSWRGDCGRCANPGHWYNYVTF